MSFSSQRMEDLIDMAEDESRITCEVCGLPGKLNAGGWLEVRCNLCTAGKGRC